MNGCLIPRTPIAVDFWKIRECPQAKIFFLTHLHGDHITGLTSSWRFPIYCSEITKRLMVHKLGIDEKLIHILEIGCTTIVYLDNEQSEQMTVTAIDAQHCPGAIMILMQGYFGTILHTGDFRYHVDMVTSSILSQYSGKVDTLYLDNTYCMPSCRFPVREDAVKQIINFIEKHPSSDVLIAMRNLGKETLLCDVALYFQEWISVSGKFYESLQIMGAPDVFDSSSTEHRIRVIPFHKVSNRFVEKVTEDRPTIVIIPTALYCGIDATPYANNKHVFVVPYSDHSSYTEIVEFVSFLKPGKIIPIVEAKARGPFGCNIENRADMSQFAKFTNPSKSSYFVIPTSVQTFMNCGNSVGTVGKNGTKRKKKLTQRPNVKKLKKGVAYESPDSKHASVEHNDDLNNHIVEKEKENMGDIELNKQDKDLDICDKSNKPISDDKTTTRNQEIDTELFDEQIEKVKTSIDFRLPTFDKALGRNTYSRSVIKRKCDATNNATKSKCDATNNATSRKYEATNIATDMSEEVEETTKHARCVEYVNSLDADFDVIEEADIDWNEKSSSTQQRKRSRRSKKSEKSETKQDDDSGKIIDKIADRTLSTKTIITKRKSKTTLITERKNLKQKRIGDFLPTSVNNSENCRKSSILQTVINESHEAIVLSDSLDDSEGEKYVATKLPDVDEEPTISSQSEIITAINDTRSEVDSDRLVIITDSEEMSVTNDNSVKNSSKRRSNNIKNNNKVVPNDLVVDETNVETDDHVLVINDKLELSVESISTDGLDDKEINNSITHQIGTQFPKHTGSDDNGSDLNDSVTPQIGTQFPQRADSDDNDSDLSDSITPQIGTQFPKCAGSDDHGSNLNDSITPQIGTQHPKHVVFEELDLDKHAGLNDSGANGGHDQIDENDIHQQKNERIRKICDNMVKFDQIYTTKSDQDENHSDNEINDESVNVNIGTQVINETVKDGLDEEACTVDQRSDDNSENEHSISVVNDSVEVMAGTQAFLNQSFNDTSEFIEADFTKHNDSGFDNSIEGNIGTQMDIDAIKDDSESEHSPELPIAIDEIDGESNEVGNGSEHSIGNSSRQRTSTPNCKSNKSKYFISSNNSDKKLKEDRDMSLNVSSMKFKPLIDKGVGMDDLTRKNKVNKSISHKLGGILKDHSNTNGTNIEGTKSADSELGAFIKAFKYFDNIQAQQRLNGVLELEEKLRKKAYKRYLLGVESGQYKEHSMCSFRVKPL